MHIERDGIQNLIMLCLECHKIVDQLERLFSVETLRQWKRDHVGKITSLFAIPNLKDERTLLTQISELLDINASVFTHYGPFSTNVLNGEAGDGIRIWRKRCLDTIIPNNQRILLLIENNKRNFPYPWEVYSQALIFRMHAEAFQDNCLTDNKVNDYKTFPREFDFFVKTKLGVHTEPLEQRASEELDFRSKQIETYINRFLSSHSRITALQALNQSTMLVNVDDGTTIKVFVTNTYVFTEYTFDKVMAVDPAIEAIICSCPAGGYSDGAKRLCIENGIGLFMLGEFMGAIGKQGEDYLNYLLKSERQERLEHLGRTLWDCGPASGLEIYAFGSYLRRKVFADIDLMIVYRGIDQMGAARNLEASLTLKLQGKIVDITVASLGEFEAIKLNHNNLTRVIARPPGRFW
jgi:hypothetical protein